MRGRFAHGVNQVAHGLGLRQIHAAVEEGTLGEFARFCQTEMQMPALLQNRADNHAKKHRTTVRLNFENALPRVARGPREVKHDRLIKEFPRGVENRVEMRVPGRERTPGKERIQDVRIEVFRERKTNDTDAAASRGGSDGNDRILVAC